MRARACTTRLVLDREPRWDAAALEDAQLHEVRDVILRTHAPHSVGSACLHRAAGPRARPLACAVGGAHAVSPVGRCM
jgi:hypothetical protein